MSFVNQNNLAHVRHVIAVAAGKGGVGKSMIAVNLAHYFSSQGFKVGLLDADLYGPSQNKMLAEGSLPLQHWEIKERMIPAVSQGIKLISMAYFLGENDPASVRAPIANGIIKQFIHLVDWDELDYLIIDFPPGTGDIQLTLMQEGALSGAVIVTTPQEIALLDVSRACTMFSQMQVPLIGLVENMSYFLANDQVRYYPLGKGGGEQFAKVNGIYFLGSVPLDPLISQCCDQGKSIFNVGSDLISALSLRHIAENVKEQLESFEALQQGHLKHFDLHTADIHSFHPPK